MRISKLMLAVATVLVASSSFAGSTAAVCKNQASAGRYDSTGFSKKKIAKTHSVPTPAEEGQK